MIKFGASADIVRFINVRINVYYQDISSGVLIIITVGKLSMSYATVILMLSLVQEGSPIAGIMI